MIPLTFLALILTLITAAPTPISTNSSCKAKNFDKPWTLKDITVWEPTAGSVSKAGQITFHFCDPNTDLQLSTNCAGEVTDGACEGEDGGYVICENEDVAFKLSGGQMLVERSFVDDCLGPYPYNRGNAFGQNATEMITQSAEGAGKMSTQAEMLVHITAMA